MFFGSLNRPCKRHFDFVCVNRSSLYEYKELLVTQEIRNSGMIRRGVAKKIGNDCCKLCDRAVVCHQKEELAM